MTCRTCELVKPEADFPKERNGLRKKKCKLCTMYYYIELRYGLSREAYDDLVAAQGGRCAICHNLPRGRHKRLVVDHCHESGVVRGLLCAVCNHGLGILGDTEEILLSALAYTRAAKG